MEVPFWKTIPLSGYKSTISKPMTLINSLVYFLHLSLLFNCLNHSSLVKLLYRQISCLAQVYYFFLCAGYNYDTYTCSFKVPQFLCIHSNSIPLNYGEHLQHHLCTITFDGVQFVNKNAPFKRTYSLINESAK